MAHLGEYIGATKGAIYIKCYLRVRSRVEP